MQGVREKLAPTPTTFALMQTPLLLCIAQGEPPYGRGVALQNWGNIIPPAALPLGGAYARQTKPNIWGEARAAHPSRGEAEGSGVDKYMMLIKKGNNYINNFSKSYYV